MINIYVFVASIAQSTSGGKNMRVCASSYAKPVQMSNKVKPRARLNQGPAISILHKHERDSRYAI